MIKKPSVGSLCTLLSVLLVGVSASRVSAGQAKPGISGLQVSARTVPLYEKFELTFQARGDWENPFDPDQVSIDCRIQPPVGQPYWMPAFYFQDHHLVRSGPDEYLEPYGPASWKVRVTPTVPGTHRYHLRLRNGSRIVETGVRTFRATANSSKKGFVRVAKENPYYFEFDNGEPYFVVGGNMLVGQLSTLERHLSSLARAGGNFIRTWWCYRTIDLESQVSDHPQKGLGRISQDAAWAADYQIEMADRLGITVMACFETQQFLREKVRWDVFTYNAANGGPVVTPGDYFTNREAAKYFKRKLRYIVARWSYATSVFSWQFWNEVNSANNFDVVQAADWHREMAHYLREIDPYRHLIHTNFGHLDGRELIDSQPEMEVVSTNTYSRRDMAETATWAARFMTSRHRKPYLLTEYGLGHEGGWAENDPKGIMVHNGLWGAVMGGAAGGALPWGWDLWVDARNMYPYFDALSRTVRAVPFHRLSWAPVEFERFIFRTVGSAPYFSNMFFEGFPRNYSFAVCPEDRSGIFRINADGTVDNAACFNAVLPAGGTSAAFDPDEQDDFSALQSASSRQTLRIEMPVSGQLIIYVPEIGRNHRPILSVEVNGEVRLRKELQQDRPGEAWAYFKGFPVELRAGSHEVTVANAQVPTGNRWDNVLYVAYELTNYRPREGPKLDYVGLQSDDHIFIWLRNPDFTWMFDRMGRVPVQQPEGVLSFPNVPVGRYSVAWMNTVNGEEMGRDIISTHDGRIELVTPSIARSAVAHLVRMKR